MTYRKENDDTVQIQNNEHLRRYTMMNKTGVYKGKGNIPNVPLVGPLRE